MQQKLEDTLAHLVSIPSVSADPQGCHEIVAYIKTEIEALGLFIHSQVDTASPWLIATTKDTVTPHILLAAHLDVVPAPSELFSMQKHDGILYGRGVYDMKLAAACYLELLKAHIESLRDLNIGILFTTDEETGGQSMTEVLGFGVRPNVVFIPDGGDNWLLEKRAKGLCGIELTAYGKTAHGSRPWEGENALHTLLDVLQTLRAKYPSNAPSAATLAVNHLRGGETINQLPATASVMVDFRSFDQQEITEFQTLIEQLADIHQLQTRVISSGDPLLIDPKDPRMKTFLNALQKQLGTTDIHYCESYGASDARYFAQYDIPCIVIEPRGGGRHSNDEWLEANDLMRFYQLIERWIIPDVITTVEVQAPENKS